jgi:hypothetical protein
MSIGTAEPKSVHARPLFPKWPRLLSDGHLDSPLVEWNLLIWLLEIVIR